MVRIKAKGLDKLIQERYWGNEFLIINLVIVCIVFFILFLFECLLPVIKFIQFILPN